MHVVDRSRARASADLDAAAVSGLVGTVRHPVVGAGREIMGFGQPAAGDAGSNPVADQPVAPCMEHALSTQCRVG